MKAMILAAGRGNRMRPLTDCAPKPLLKVDNHSLIEHLLLKLSAHGFKDIVINLAHLGSKIVAKLGDGKSYGVRIRYSFEDEGRGLETGGGVFKALPLLGEQPFLVVSGDIWTNYPFSSLKNKSLKGLAHLVLVNNPPEHVGGDFLLSKDRLIAGAGKKLTFGNIGVYHPDLFSNCEPGYFPLAPLLHEAVANGVVSGEHFQGEWLNVGTPNALETLRQLIKKRAILKDQGLVP